MHAALAGLILTFVLGCGSSAQPPPALPSNAVEATPAPTRASGPAPADATALALDALEPAKGDAAGGTYVVLTGQRFLADGPRSVKVYFGALQGTVVRFASDTELIVQAPSGQAGETVDVRAEFDPGGERVLRAGFTFVAVTPGP